MEKLTKETLDQLKASSTKDKSTNYIYVGMSTCGIAAGSDEIYDYLIEEAGKKNINIEVKKCGCLGMCSVEPIIEVAVEGLPTVHYGRVTEEVAKQIIEDHIENKKLVNDHIYDINLKR